MKKAVILLPGRDLAMLPTAFARCLVMEAELMVLLLARMDTES